jgi:hypothetical protein
VASFTLQLLYPWKENLSALSVVPRADLDVVMKRIVTALLEIKQTIFQFVVSLY